MRPNTQTTYPGHLPPKHLRHDLINAAISVGIVLAVFLIAPAIGGAIAEWAVNGRG